MFLEQNNCYGNHGNWSGTVMVRSIGSESDDYCWVCGERTGDNCREWAVVDGWIMRRGSMVKPRLSIQDRSQPQPGTCSQGTKKASAELHQQFHIAAHLTEQQSMRNDIERFSQVTKRKCQQVTWPISLLTPTIYLWLMCLLLPCNKCCWWKITKKLEIICLCLILNTIQFNFNSKDL